MNSFKHMRDNLDERIRRLRDATAVTRGPAPEICGDCRGTGWIIRKENGNNRAHRCECWIRENTGKLKQRTGIPERYTRCTFDNFTVYPNEDIERAFRRSRDFAARFPVRQNSLLLAGPSGIGKTIWPPPSSTSAPTRASAACTARPRLCSPSCAAPTTRTQGPRTPTSCSAWPTRTCSSSTTSARTTSRTGDRTCSTRSSTPATTTTAPQSAQRRLPPSPHERDSLLFEIGGRLLSMLHQMCDVIEFDGADYRHAGDHPGADTLQ